MNKRFSHHFGLLAVLLFEQIVLVEGSGSVPVKAWCWADVLGVLFSDVDMTPVANNMGIHQWGVFTGTSPNLLQGNGQGQACFFAPSVFANFNPTVTITIAMTGCNSLLQLV